jgi:hypothetical protein
MPNCAPAGRWSARTDLRPRVPGRRRSPPGRGRAGTRPQNRGAHALGVLGVEPTARVAGSLGEQRCAGRRQLRGHRLSGRGHPAGRPFAGYVQHATTLPSRHVHRLTEVTRQPARRRHDHVAIPVRGKHRPRQPHRSPAEPLAPTRQPLRQPHAHQLAQQRVRRRLRDPQLVRNLGWPPNPVARPRRNRAPGQPWAR